MRLLELFTIIACICGYLLYQYVDFPSVRQSSTSDRRPSRAILPNFLEKADSPVYTIPVRIRITLLNWQSSYTQTSSYSVSI